MLNRSLYQSYYLQKKLDEHALHRHAGETVRLAATGSSYDSEFTVPSNTTLPTSRRSSGIWWEQAWRKR